jgi:hypothetical protein
VAKGLLREEAAREKAEAAAAAAKVKTATAVLTDCEISEGGNK